MSTATICPTSSEPALYRPQTLWNPVSAVFVMLAVLGAAIFAGIAFFFLYGAVNDPSAAWLDSDSATPNWVMLAAQLTMQIVSIGLIWWVAGWSGGDRKAVLSLHGIPGGTATLLKSFLLLSVISGAFTVYALSFASEDILTDLAPMWPLIQGNYGWLLAVVAVIGAPISEEFAFRGFLQSSLAKTPFGFWGAAIITNSAWTGLHAGYTATGLADVFIAGLVFSWVLWRTGSLWVPVICHGLYNGLIFLALYMMEIPQGLPVPAV